VKFQQVAVHSVENWEAEIANSSDSHYHITIDSREVLAKSVIAGRLGLDEAATEFKLSRQSAAKWVKRFAPTAGPVWRTAPRARATLPAEPPRSWSRRSTRSPKRRQLERSRWFRKPQAWRTGCEGRISVVKRRHGLIRCRSRGPDGMKRWVGLSIMADTLINIGRAMAGANARVRLAACGPWKTHYEEAPPSGSKLARKLNFATESS